MPKLGNPPSLAGRIKALADGGMSAAKIADECGVSDETAAGYVEHLRAHGVIVETPPAKPHKSESEDHKKPTSDKAFIPKMRICLRCQATFKEQFPKNFICRSCRGTQAWREGE